MPEGSLNGVKLMGGIHLKVPKSVPSFWGKLESKFYELNFWVVSFPAPPHPARYSKQ